MQGAHGMAGTAVRAGQVTWKKPRASCSSHWDQREGKGGWERSGWTSTGAKLAVYRWVEATLQWKKTIRWKEEHPTPPHPALQKGQVLVLTKGIL